MAGMIRWRDLQNIRTTEDEINLLAGLIVSAEILNQLVGFSGIGTELNQAIASVQTLNLHLLKDLATAHPLLENSLDGGVIAGKTLGKEKLSFIPLTDADQVLINNAINSVRADLAQAVTQIQNLYSIVVPGQASDIAESIAQMVEHVQKTSDAHDASAISFGNQYVGISNISAGADSLLVSLADIKYFKSGDIIAIKDVYSGPEERTIQYVNYNNGRVYFSPSVVQSYSASYSLIVTIKTQDNVQEAINRSLRNTTDAFTGRLSIDQSSTDNAIEINKTNTGYTLKVNDFSEKSDANHSIELGKNDGSTIFEIQNSDKRKAFSVKDDGITHLNNIFMEDRSSQFLGEITKQPLTNGRNWILPDRSGYIGLGDLTFTELLKVRTVSPKSISISPGFGLDYEGQIISAWISMEHPSMFPGGTVNLENIMLSANQLVTLGSKYQVVTIYINDADMLGYFFGPQESIRKDAISKYENFIPSVYMKLAKLLIKGDGLSGLESDSITILEDQRPFLTMGMSAAYYDESITYRNGATMGDVITLPVNTRGGGSLITYKPGKSQLEVYLDGVYQRVDIDYAEHQGEPIAQIRLFKNLAKNSVLRFRITFKAAAVSGGIQVDTLQSVYQAGASIGLSGIYGPIKMFGFDINTLLEVEGNVVIQGLIRSASGLELVAQTSFLGDPEKDQLYLNENHELILHTFSAGESKDFNICGEIRKSQKAVTITVTNYTGTTITKNSALSMHPSLINSVVLCDVSGALSISRLDGIAMENIASGSSGQMIISGYFEDAALSFPHNSVLVVDPRTPGKIVLENSVVWLPTDKRQEVGKTVGSALLVDIDRNKKENTIWDTAIAGEAFEANKTKLVRFALYGETAGAVYAASKGNANLEEKFWAIAFVQPSTNIAAGETINLYKKVKLTAKDVNFDNYDYGKPFYLADNGEFLPWRLIKGTYNLGDAIYKVGITKTTEVVIDSSQMMGTAPGPIST